MPKKKSTSKTTTKKVATKKTATKKAPAAKKVTKKKTVTKKAATKKPTSKKVVTKKAAPKKTANKKAPAKAKKIQTTRIVARVDVGFGNQLYIRGEGGGLSWDSGVIMVNLSPYEWAITTHFPAKEIEFKFLINDELWAEGPNMRVLVGKESVSSPMFLW